MNGRGFLGLIVIGVLAAGFEMGVARAQQPTAWKAGVATVKITPSGPIRMAGYGARKSPSEGVAADLFAKALAVEDPRGTRIVILTLDLIEVSRPLRDWLVAEVKQKHGLEKNGLLINVSHTHCGPVVGESFIEDTQSPPEQRKAVGDYITQLRPKLAGVISESLQRLAPARLDFVHARAGFAMNRRRPTLQGYSNAPNFDGPVDHEVPVLRVAGADGKLVALLFGYACHNTTMGDLMIRGDYAGYAQQYLEQSHPGVTAMFMIGCGADQNPYPRRTEELAKYHGRTLAVAVDAALETVAKPLGGPLVLDYTDVTLDFAPPPSRAELEAVAATGKDPARWHAQWLLNQLREKGRIPTTYPCPVQMVRFGRDLTLIAIGGETCVDYSLRLKRELAGSAVWVAGYSNDVFTYLPSARVLAEGGYEAGGASVWDTITGPFTPTCEERVISAALGMARTPIESLPTVVDLKIGQQATVKLADGRPATVKLLKVSEHRDTVRHAVRSAQVTVEVNGREVTLGAATYHLPTTVGDVQIDCPITAGCHVDGDEPSVWALDSDARLRLWPAGYPWITPGTFAYPINQRWFASRTLMANQIADGDNIKKKRVYYHYGLDIGGAEGMVDVLAATDGQIVSAAGEVLEPGNYPSLVKSRADVVYVRDGRGWYYRYSHLDSIDPAARLGASVKMGQKIGILGKKGASGGWSHLHFDIVAPQPNGKWGILEGYAFLFEAYHQAHPLEVLEAVARPHQLVSVGETVTLDGTRSWSRRGTDHIASYIWMLSDGKTARGPLAQRKYAKPGEYNEVLMITDRDGNVSLDFATVYVVDPQRLDEQPPRIHAVFWPTSGLQAGDEITFKVRSFNVAPDEGEEEWNFGDGTPPVHVRSDGNADKLAPDGYAITTHRYQNGGRYLVKVSRTNRRGETATARLDVVVRPR